MLPATLKRRVHILNGMYAQTCNGTVEVREEAELSHSVVTKLKSYKRYSRQCTQRACGRDIAPTVGVYLQLNPKALRRQTKIWTVNLNPT